ncbi:NPCBM/NEW2 domain-containing protein [Actinomadura sp. WMMB 499]|uniref:NPCBM/NEW2 domain-containing protein n=1 Tax=Actinomadura sp. WMMB 499 TaxID=1219491 RepID=UPI001247FB23|nr:NPCBM/NEW2 domain-containing protein [Actinomadura sp. WMMB 499]QFG22248.1 hypothetical protein F7P10_15055 [Actinomadura sp. WMMB 499]
MGPGDGQSWAHVDIGTEQAESRGPSPTGPPAGGRKRPRTVRAALTAVPILAAFAAGTVFGGDWTWGGFAASMVLVAVLLLHGGRPAGGTAVQAAGRDNRTTTTRISNVRVNTGGATGVLGVALIVLIDGLLVAHVSTSVPGGLYYSPAGSSTTSPTFLRDLDEDKIRAVGSGLVEKTGMQIGGRQCARSVTQQPAPVGLARTITVTRDEGFQRFKARAGIADDLPSDTTVEFAVTGDDREVARRTATPRSPVDFDVDVSAYTVLELRSTVIASKISGVYAVWGDAQLLPARGAPVGCVTGES